LSGAIRLEIESMLADVHTDITNIRKQGDEFYKENEDK